MTNWKFEQKHPWIIKGRQLTKRTVNACLLCRKCKVKPAQQISAPLPEQHIEEAPPFEITGVDFAGPLYCKSQDKAYIAPFHLGSHQSYPCRISD